MAKKDDKTRAEALDEEIVVEEVSADFQGEEASAIDNFNKNKRFYIGGLVALLLIVAGTFYFIESKQESEAAAWDDAEMAIRAYMQDSLDMAIEGTATFTGLRQIQSRHSGSEAANLATYLMGTAALKKGELDEGIRLLEEYDKSEKTLISAMAYRALGFAYEEKGDYATAADRYTQAAKAHPNRTTSPTFRMHAARALELAEKTDDAREVYQDIARLYPNSQEGPQAEKHLARLTK